MTLLLRSLFSASFLHAHPYSVMIPPSKRQSILTNSHNKTIWAIVIFTPRVQRPSMPLTIKGQGNFSTEERTKSIKALGEVTKGPSTHSMCKI